MLTKRIVFLLFSTISLFPVRARAQEEVSSGIFPLIPLIETAFSGELRWRPDWPLDMPPDGFLLPKEGKDASPQPLALVLANEVESFSFRRDGAAHLREFPFFLPGSAALKVSAGYASSGAMTRMRVIAPGGSGAEGGDAAETVWDLTFPPDFFPYGAVSPGGTFPAAVVSQGDTRFWVFFHESPVFLSETWYDEEGNLLAFFKADVYQENGSWRVLSLQSRDAEGQSSAEYAFDSGGNISEVDSPAGRFQAVYRGSRPRYWQRQPLDTGAAEDEGEGPKPETSPSFNLQWDERGFLVRLVSSGGSEGTSLQGDDSPVEYRYEYERERSGNWIKRQDIEISGVYGAFQAKPGRTWTRKISFTE